jgi:hypothetical protein
MCEFLIGCSGWNYDDTPDKGGWTGIFYPDKETRRILRLEIARFLSQATISTFS